MKPFTLPRRRMPINSWARIASAYDVLLDEWLAVSVKMPETSIKARGTRLYDWWRELGIACDECRQAKESKSKFWYRRAFAALRRINRLNQRRINGLL
jgi:hypothetical protein